MIRKSTISILILSCVAFLGGLVGSITAQSKPRAETAATAPVSSHPLQACLKLDADCLWEIDQADPTFNQDLARLRVDLATERQTLAALLESPDSADTDIRACVERSITAHNALERRVTDYLLAVRPKLSACQQKKLFDVVSKEVRRSARRCCGGGPLGDAGLLGGKGGCGHGKDCQSCPNKRGRGAGCNGGTQQRNRGGGGGRGRGLGGGATATGNSP